MIGHQAVQNHTETLPSTFSTPSIDSEKKIRSNYSMENGPSLQTSTASPSFTPAESLSIASPAKDHFLPHPLRWSSYGLRLKKKREKRGGGGSSCFLLSHATWRTKRNFLVAIGKNAYISWVSRRGKVRRPISSVNGEIHDPRNAISEHLNKP